MNAYHNLAGWLRDVKAVLNEGNDLANTYRQHLLDLVAELVPPECYSGEEAEDEEQDADADGESSADELEDGDDEVAVRQPGVSRITGAKRRAVGGGSADVVGRLASVASSVPPDVQEGGRRRGGGAQAVARAGKRVSRGKK